MVLDNIFIKLITHTYTHIHHFNSHYPGEPGIAGCPFMIIGVEASFFMAEMAFLSPTHQHQCNKVSHLTRLEVSGKLCQSCITVGPVTRTVGRLNQLVKDQHLVDFGCMLA